MKKWNTCVPRLAVLAALPVLAGHAQVLQQWDFDNGNLAATAGGQDLQFLDAAAQNGTSFGTTTSFGIPNPGGTEAKVAKVTGFTRTGDVPAGLGMPVAAAANGGGSLVNNWTVILDLLSPTTSDKQWRALLETDNHLEPDADFFINNANGIGISSAYSGNITPNEWHRIAFVIDTDSNKIRKYLDGEFVGSLTAAGLDGRWSLTPGGNVELFTDNDGEVAPLYVNSIQFRDEALNTGQIAALGKATANGIPQSIPAVAAFIESSTPETGATGVAPKPDISIVLNPGASTVSSSSVKLLFDEAPVNATVTPDSGKFNIAYTVPDNLDPRSLHRVGVVYSENGTVKTNSFTFSIADYQKVILPAPIYLETFDSVEEGSLPAGWSVTNRTDVVTEGLDLDNLTSDTYRDWTVVNKDRLQGLKAGIFAKNPISLNGTFIESLGNGNVLHAESDTRDNNQVQVIFTKDYDLTGKTNIFVAFNSMYEQNQDNAASLEYSIDQGATWLPLLYLIDDEGKAADVIRKADGTIDAVATLNTAHSDAAWGLSYGAFIGAQVTQDLAPFISGRINDDNLESKRIEVIRAIKADNQPKVRFRMMQAGTGSWYWTIDDFGIYTINAPVVSQQPAAATVVYGDTATLKATATGAPPLSYQWYQNGTSIPGATSDTLVLNNVTGANAGDYTVVVRNNDGPTTSAVAHLTVVVAPEITAPPVPAFATAGAPVTLTAAARGQTPLSYQWQKNGTNINGATSASFTIPAAAAGDAGDYRVVVTNPSGSATSSAVTLKVAPLTPITQDLVLHLPFDGDANDTSGKGNNGTPEVQPEIAGGTLPAYEGGGTQVIGSKAIHITDGQDINLGGLPDLQFGSDVNFTLSFWLKAPDASAWTGDPSFVGNKNWTSGGSQGFVLAAQGSGAWKWNWKAETGNRKDIGFGSLSDGKWHNIVVSHDRAGLAYFYVDGVQKGTMPIVNDGSIDLLDLHIAQDGTGRYGFDNDLGAHFKNIYMDDFGIWRRALSAQEASSIYAQGLKGSDLTTASGEVTAPAEIAIGSIQRSGSNLVFSVSGQGAFQLQKKTSITDSTWTNVGATVTTGSFSVPTDGQQSFFRVVKQ